MNLPKGFQQLTEAETDKMLTLGKKQVDALHNSDIDISDKDPIIFKKDNNNYFMIHVKEYDPSIDGDYNEAVRNTKNELYETYRNTFKNARIDTVTTSEKIDTVLFDQYALTIRIPPKTKMHILSYAALKKGKDISVAVVYMDKKIGAQILQSLQSAKFVE